MILDTLIAIYHQLKGLGIWIVAIIFAVFLIAFISNIIIRRRYIILQEDLLDWRNRKESKFRSEILNMILENYRSTATGNYNEVNTQAIIEKAFNLRMRGFILGERFIRNTNALLITLGLLGTFAGLTVAVAQISNIFINMDMTQVLESTSIKGFLSHLVTALSGMSVAFVTSLVGVGCSILLTILTTIVNAEEARETLMVHIEEYLDNTVALVVAKDKETEYTIMNNILKDTFRDFGERIEKSLKTTVESFGEKLTNVVMDVSFSSSVLDSTVEKFDRSLANFTDNMKSLSEFNMNMRNNIERMDVNFIKVTEALTRTSELVVQNYRSIEDFAEKIWESANEMTSYNRQLADDITRLAEDMAGTVENVRKFAGMLDEDIQVHRRELEVYQEHLSSLVSRLTGEIAELGRHAAQSFTETISGSSQELTRNLQDSLATSYREILALLEEFRQNQMLFARTISALPEQVMAYNEAASARLEHRLAMMKSSGQPDL